MAEGEGFEPPDLSVNGFQDRRLKPLGHPSGSLDPTCAQSLRVPAQDFTRTSADLNNPILRDFLLSSTVPRSHKHR